MKNILILILLINLSSCSLDSNSEKTNSKNEKIDNVSNSIIDVKINKNLETLGIIFALGMEDYFEYDETLNKKAHLLKYILNSFRDFKNHPAVLKAKFLAENDIMYMTNAQIGLKFTDLPDFKNIEDLELSVYYTKEEQVHINEFIKLVPSFYKDAQIDSFLIANSDLYDRIIQEAKQSLPDIEKIRTLEEFHGIKMNSYTLIPSPSIPNYYNYGVRMRSDN